jgi:hypothetical protein
MAEARPLRVVTYRGPLTGGLQGGWYDRLECGHVVPYNGANVNRRRCPDCPPGPLEPVLQPSITCPRCGRTSYNLNDIREGYCGNCHDWTSAKPVQIVCDPQLLDYNAKGWWPFDRVPK